MNNKIMETLEVLEEKIESIKWLITPPFSFRKVGISNAISAIRRSAGILGKDSIKGTVFENEIRKGWKNNVLKRIG